MKKWIFLILLIVAASFFLIQVVPSNHKTQLLNSENDIKNIPLDVLFEKGMKAYSSEEYLPALQIFLQVIQGDSDKAMALRAAYLIRMILTEKISMEKMAKELQNLRGLSSDYLAALKASQVEQIDQLAAHMSYLQLKKPNDRTESVLFEDLLQASKPLTKGKYLKFWEKEFAQVRDLAVDPSGRIWVLVEKRPLEIIRLTQRGEVDKRISFSHPEQRFNGGDLINEKLAVFSDGSFVVGNAKFNAKGRPMFGYDCFLPDGIAVGPEDSLYMACRDNGLIKFDKNGRMFWRAGQERGFNKGELVHVWSIAAAKGLIAVADSVPVSGGNKNRIQVFDDQGKVLHALGGLDGDYPWPSDEKHQWAVWEIGMDIHGRIFGVYDENKANVIKVYEPNLKEIEDIELMGHTMYRVDPNGIVYCISKRGFIAAFVPASVE